MGYCQKFHENGSGKYGKEEREITFGKRRNE
jgi:hypothetical protein